MIVWKCPKCGNHVIGNEYWCPFFGWKVEGNIEDYFLDEEGT